MQIEIDGEIIYEGPANHPIIHAFPTEGVFTIRGAYGSDNRSILPEPASAARDIRPGQLATVSSANWHQLGAHFHRSDCPGPNRPGRSALSGGVWPLLAFAVRPRPGAPFRPKLWACLCATSARGVASPGQLAIAPAANCTHSRYRVPPSARDRGSHRDRAGCGGSYRPPIGHGQDGQVAVQTGRPRPLGLVENCHRLGTENSQLERAA